MITEELVQYLLENVSSTEFDVIIYAALNSDWDGRVHLTAKQIANSVGSKEKYVKWILKRLSSDKKGRKLFACEEFEGELTYRFVVGKTKNLGFNEVTDRYCKNYSFFHLPAFRDLSIHAKRLLLLSAFKMSISQNETVDIDYLKIVPSKNSTAISTFTRGRLLDSIKEIQTSELNEVVTISMSTLYLIKKEVINFNYTPGTLENFEENHTEALSLRKRIAKAGHHSYLSNDFCTEIVKMGKYIFNSFSQYEKEFSRLKGAFSGAKDSVLALGRYIYNTAIDRFAVVLNSNHELLNDAKQASAYFSSVIQDITFEELAKLNNRSENISSLLEINRLNINQYNSGVAEENKLAADTYDAELNSKLIETNYLYSILEAWNTSWITSRVDSIVTQAKTVANDQNSKTGLRNRLFALKNQLIKQINAFYEHKNIFGLKHMSANNNNFITKLSNYITETIDLKVGMLISP